MDESKRKNMQFMVAVVVASVSFSLINPKVFLPIVAILWLLGIVSSNATKGFRSKIPMTEAVGQNTKKELSLKNMPFWVTVVIFLVLSVANPLVAVLTLVVGSVVTGIFDLGSGEYIMAGYMTVAEAYLWIALSILFYFLLTLNRYKKIEKKLARKIELKDFLSIYLPAQASWLPFLLFEIAILLAPELMLLLAFGGFFVFIPLVAYWAVIIDKRFHAALKKEYPEASQQKI